VPNSRYIPRRDAKGCAWCGRQFEQTRSDARYCSGRCRVAALRARRAAPPFRYRFAPVAASVPDDETLERLAASAARRRWRGPYAGDLEVDEHKLADWLDRESGEADVVSEQEAIDAANYLAHALGRRRPLVAYPIGAHPEDGARFDGRLLPSYSMNRRRWDYRAWLAELDGDERRRVADALIAAARHR
jgi:hypothetical protein